MAIGIKLEDNNVANGLTEDWAEVERVCRRHDEKWTRTWSTTTWPTSGGAKRVTSDDRLPLKEESSMRKGLMVHVKAQIDTEGDPKTKSKLRQTIDEEEVAS